MEQHIQAERIANAIMLDNTFTGHYIVVEGVKDTKFFSKYIDHNGFRLREAFGNYKVKSVLEILTKRGFDRKLGIIDSDFNMLLGIKIEIPDLFVTDDHDLEVMIFKTKALEVVIRFYCSTSKVIEFEKAARTTVRGILFELAQQIAYLKLANKIYNLGLVFKPSTADGNQIKYKNFIDDKTLRFKGIKDLIETVRNYSNGKTTGMKSYEEIEERLRSELEKEYDVDHVVSGHDLSNILFLILKKTFSSNSRTLVDHNAIEDSLILAYDFSDFQKTRLFRSLSAWAIKKQLSMFQQAT